MQRTKIEWVKNQDGTQGYTLNPVKGMCPMACPYCDARRMYKGFRWNPDLRLDVDSFLPLLETIKRKPSRIFIGSTMELFGDWIQPEWMRFIFERVRMLPEHTFLFLTKQPQNLIKWSPFPPNTYIGVSVTNQSQYDNAVKYLAMVEAPVKFLSLEPLAEASKLSKLEEAGVQWIIIGQQTPASVKTSPKVEWIREIVEAADKAKIPVFLKENLKSLIDSHYPDPTELTCNHNRLVRSPPLQLCGPCLELVNGACSSECGIIWELRQEFPKVQKDGLERLRK